MEKEINKEKLKCMQGNKYYIDYDDSDAEFIGPNAPISEQTKEMFRELDKELGFEEEKY